MHLTQACWQRMRERAVNAARWSGPRQPEVSRRSSGGGPCGGCCCCCRAARASWARWRPGRRDRQPPAPNGPSLKWGSRRRAGRLPTMSPLPFTWAYAALPKNPYAENQVPSDARLGPVGFFSVLWMFLRTPGSPRILTSGPGSRCTSNYVLTTFPIKLFTMFSLPLMFTLI